MSRKIVVGSRGSRLAMVQTESVIASIRKTRPDIEVNIQKIVTRGDRDRHISLDRMDSIGIFVKELEEALRDGRIDLAVHSLKDMPTDIPTGLRLSAVTGRADPRDVLVSRGEKLSDLKKGAKIGTGSLRRAVQLGVCRPDTEACNIRGNVDTRLRKVVDGEFDGAILAAAALQRLGMDDRITEYLDTKRFLPAVGQGALAIEVRADDKEVNAIITSLNDLAVWQSVTAERAFLLALGGGCRAPIAALGTVNGVTLKLEGMIAGVSSRKALRISDEGSAGSPEELGNRLAQRLFDMGAQKLLNEAES